MLAYVRRVILLVITAGLLLAGCGGGSEAEGPLVIYSGRSEDLVAPLLEAFETETGIEVEIRYGDSTELAATLLQEGESTNTDVFFAQDPASLGAIGDLAEQLPGDLLSKVDAKFSDRDGRWVGVSGRSRVIAYNSASVDAADLPDTLAEIAGWGGTIGIAPTNGSFLAFVATIIATDGEDVARTWLNSVAAADRREYPNNSSILNGLAAGEVQIGLVNHYYLFRLRAEGAGAGVENYFPQGGDAASLVLPAGVAVLGNTDQPDSAHRFVEFLLSEYAQSYFADNTFEYPLVAGIGSDLALPPLESLTPPEFNLSDLAEHLERATELVAEAGLV